MGQRRRQSSRRVHRERRWKRYDVGREQLLLSPHSLAQRSGAGSVERLRFSARRCERRSVDGDALSDSRADAIQGSTRRRLLSLRPHAQGTDELVQTRRRSDRSGKDQRADFAQRWQHAEEAHPHLVRGVGAGRKSRADAISDSHDLRRGHAVDVCAQLLRRPVRRNGRVRIDQRACRLLYRRSQGVPRQKRNGLESSRARARRIVGSDRRDDRSVLRAPGKRHDRAW